MRFVGLSMLVLALGVGGCVAEDTAGAELEIVNGEMSGVLGGVTVAGLVDRQLGACAPSGFNVELARTGLEGTLMNEIDVRDLFLRSREGTFFFLDDIGDGTMTMLEPVAGSDTRGAIPSMVFTGCAGAVDGSWDTELQARVVELTVVQDSPEHWTIDYNAEFADGQNVQGSFEMDMPSVD